MLEGKKLIGTRPAAISIEITLSLVLSVAILFLVLGLFSNSIQTLAEASGLRNLFNRNNNVAKTFNDDDIKYSKVDPTATQINVQTVADQGLNYYISKAQATIDKYKTTPPTTQSATEDLARAVAIARVAGTLSGEDEALFNSSEYNIYIDSIGKTISVHGNSKQLSYTNNNPSCTDLDKIALAKIILTSIFQ